MPNSRVGKPNFGNQSDPLEHDILQISLFTTNGSNLKLCILYETTTCIFHTLPSLQVDPGPTNEIPVKCHLYHPPSNSTIQLPEVNRPTLSVKRDFIKL